MRKEQSWTQNEIDQLEELRTVQGLTIPAIAKIMRNRSAKSIAWKCQMEGIFKEKKFQIQVLQLQPLSITEIAKRTGRTYNQVRHSIRRLRKAGFSIPKRARIHYQEIPELHKKYQNAERLLIAKSISWRSYTYAWQRYVKKNGFIPKLPRLNMEKIIDKHYFPRTPKTIPKDRKNMPVDQVYTAEFLIATYKGQPCHPQSRVRSVPFDSMKTKSMTQM